MSKEWIQGDTGVKVNLGSYFLNVSDRSSTASSKSIQPFLKKVNSMIPLIHVKAYP